MNRQIRLYEPKKINIATTADTTPADGESRVRLRLGGICGSDLAAYRGTSPLVTYPRVLGHELVVDVIDAPDRPEWIGKRAVVEPLLSCNRCVACRRGRYNGCLRLKVLGVHTDGGFQNRFCVPNDRLHLVPDVIDDRTAVLAEPLSIAYRAVQRSRIDAGKTALVFGAGTIGLLIARLLTKARGCRALIVDVDPFRLQRAEAIGATPITAADDLVAAVAEQTDGAMADVVFEATGHPSVPPLTTNVVAFAGTIVLIGWHQQTVPVDTVALIRKEVTVVGSRNSKHAFPAVLNLLSDGLLNPESIITHTFPLDEAAEALQLLDTGRQPALKILLHP